MKHYMIHTPRNFYAVDVYATSERDAINQYKERWGYKRMPAGYAVWEKQS